MVPPILTAPPTAPPIKEEPNLNGLNLNLPSEYINLFETSSAVTNVFSLIYL